ncbi:MAG: hypothetical protein QOG80_2453 [Pseudonocardiales bacterium]|nr:hypothetical protein [Pseudonocardiales bacterium]
MRSRSRIIGVVLATVGLVATMTGTAAAAKPTSGYQNPVVNWIQPTVIAQSDGTAIVHAHYTCFGGNLGTHLFIAVKQGPEINATDHTSSQYANTFYSTNWNSDGPGDSLNCNGVQQNALFVLQPDPYWQNAGNNPPPLAAGPAFVQFCLFDSTSSQDDLSHGFAADYSMRKVVLG